MSCGPLLTSTSGNTCSNDFDAKMASGLCELCCKTVECGYDKSSSDLLTLCSPSSASRIRITAAVVLLAAAVVAAVASSFRYDGPMM
jgi:hypothetical protein